MLDLNTIHKLDCVEALRRLEEGSVDLAYADPPFNIGYKYDVYQDRKAPQIYLDWSRQWIAGVHRRSPRGATGFLRRGFTCTNCKYRAGAGDYVTVQWSSG